MMTGHIDKLKSMEERLIYLNKSLGSRKDDQDIAEWARMFSPELLDVHSRFIQDLKREYGEILEMEKLYNNYLERNSYDKISLHLRKSQIEYAIDKFFHCFP